VAWIEAEIDEHIADCIARRDKKHRVPPRSDSN
jgi:hypothetical protein